MNHRHTSKLFTAASVLSIAFVLASVNGCSSAPDEASGTAADPVVIAGGCRGNAGQTVDLNQPPYSALTAAEIGDCLGETAVQALQDKVKDELCLAGCLASGPAYPACAAACGIAGVLDGMINTAEFAICMRNKYNARPIRLGCDIPNENGNPGFTTVGCAQASNNAGVFDPGLAFAACRQVVGGWNSLYSNWYDTRNWTCAEVLASPGSDANATARCTGWIQSCVTATQTVCAPIALPPAPPLPVPPPPMPPAPGGGPVPVVIQIGPDAGTAI